MGRAARAKRQGRIRLEKGDFYELIAALRLVEVTRLEAQPRAVKLAAEIVQKELAEVSRRGKAVHDRLATKYGFNPEGNFAWDEKTCELIPKESLST
jgi:hypothetical protein